MDDRTGRPGEALWDLLQRMVREQLARKPGGHLVESRLEAIELRLSVALRGPEAAPRRFAESLAAQIDHLLDDAVQEAAAFRPGQAYCHRCEGAECEHSRPPSSRHVFIGYAPTGSPRWEDFAQYCLDRRHPEVDRLYNERPALVTIVQDTDVLEGGMLRAFQRGSYELLGQLVAGFFPVRVRAEEGRGVLALTVQVAASKRRRGSLKLGLNLLGRTPSGDDLDRLWDRHEELPWRKAVRWAQTALETLTPGPPARAKRAPTRSRADLERRVDGILRGLGRRLERDHRARSRRTRHAEQRHASGERPTPKAVDDVRSAGDEAWMVDERSGALVVLGERGRTHFFTPAGQLVSSVRYSKDAVARKMKSGLWRRATSSEADSLRAKLA